MTTDSTPPVSAADIAVPVFERDLETGLVKGKVYARRADGRVDWVKMIPPEHIVFNSKDERMAKAIEVAYGKPAKDLVYADVLAEGKEVDPRHILVLLMGWMELFALRGGNAQPRIAHVTSYPPEAANVTCECTIDWFPNQEEPNGFTSYGTADATMSNTGGWGYLAAMAGNRAFARAVKQGLRIPILAFDEIAKKDASFAMQESGPTTAITSTPMAVGPQASLEKAANGGNFTFDAVKKAALMRWTEDTKALEKEPATVRRIENDPTDWAAWADVPARDCTTLIHLIKSKQTAATQVAVAKTTAKKVTPIKVTTSTPSAAKAAA